VLAFTPLADHIKWPSIQKSFPTPIINVGTCLYMCVWSVEGSSSTGTSASKKTASSASLSGKKMKSSLASSHKVPSGNSKKKTAKSKAKERALRRYGWAYTGILFALLVVPVILRHRVIMQSVCVSSMWVGLYWFCTVVDHVVVSSPK